MITTCGWALNDTENEKTIAGTIVQTDWVKSMIVVRYFNRALASLDEVNIIVDRNTKMTRGTDTIYLAGILQGDQVTVIYYDDGLSGLKAKKITDLNLGNQ